MAYAAMLHISMLVKGARPGGYRQDVCHFKRGETSMYTEEHVTVIAQLRQAQRLMARGNLDVQQALEVLKLYEQGVCALMTAEQIVQYIQKRMALADEMLG